MEKQINKNEAVIFQEALFSVAQAMAKANAELQVNDPHVSNYSLQHLILAEITSGKIAANNWKHMCPGASSYTHTNQFPLYVFETLAEDFILQLESSDIYIFKHQEMDTAVIKIVFHF